MTDFSNFGYRIRPMRSNSRSLVILVCLFLISFKVAASSIFIEAAIERAQMHQSTPLHTVKPPPPPCSPKAVLTYQRQHTDMPVWD